MRISKFTISGFRNFYHEVAIDGSDIDGNLVALIGKNGSGKSTILEIINWILGRNALNQMASGYFAKGVHRDTGAKFHLAIEIEDEEKDILRSQIESLDPMNAPLAMETFDSQFATSNSFSICVNVQYDPMRMINNNEYKVTASFNGLSFSDVATDTDVPAWFRIAKSRQLLCAYIGLVSGLSLNQQQAFSAAQSVNPLADFFNHDSNQRSTRVDVSLDSTIGGLAVRSIWDIARRTLDEGNVELSIDRDIAELNDIIYPLELNFDHDQLNTTGTIEFFITNKNQPSGNKYPISDVSAGERQMIMLWSTLKNFQRSKFKPILLIDEPDNSLHPDYVLKIGSLIERSISNDNGMCLIATHSSDIVTKVPDSVYQISPESNKLEKVKNFSQKVEMLSELGRSIDLAYLTGKIVLVEGRMENINSNEGLADHEIYQRIMDPNKERITFIPTGRKKDNVAAKASIENITAILSKLNIDDIISVVDRDNDINSDKAKALPVYSIENIFLQSTSALEDSIRKVVSDDSFDLVASRVLEGKDMNNGKGKDILMSLDSHLSSKYTTYKDTGRLKAVQGLMLDAARENREAVFGKELDSFFKEIEA